MSTFLLDDDAVHVPAWVVDHASFRRWLHSDDFPEVGRVFFLQGEVWVDMSKEQLFSHNQVKQEFNRVLGNLAKTARLGRWFPDGAFLSSAEADITAVPDGIFVAHATLDLGRTRLVEGTKDGYLELEGSPDMVLEVLSDSSEEKDTEVLPDRYWQAGITEYWVVDARGELLEFDLFRHGPKGYVAARRQGGWLKSAVFERSFRLLRETDERDDPEYTLDVR
jgi:Uma2 family endonuclease